MSKTILPVSHRLSARNVATLPQLQAAASREIFPTIDGLVRKVNGDLVPCVNSLTADVTDLETTVADLEATVAGLGPSASRWVQVVGYNSGDALARFPRLNSYSGFAGTSLIGVSMVHMPGTGRVVSVTLSSQVPAGSTLVSLYKDGNPAFVASASNNMLVVDTGYLFDFSGYGTFSEWTLGQSLSFSVHPSSFPGEVWMGILWELDA